MAKSQSKSAISLLTFNTLGTPIFAPMITKRYKKLTEYLNTSDIDVLCLQEVASYYHLHLLKKYLTQYPYHAYKKFLFGPKGGVVIFSKLPLESVRYDSFAALGSLTMYTQLLRNGILSCKIKGYSLRILNTHLITDFEYKSSRHNRYYPYVKKQMQETGVLMERLSVYGDTLIATGDFNLSKNDPTYHEFLQATGSVDLFKKYDSPTYYNDRYQWRYMASKSVRIDYIFLLDKYDKISVTSLDHVFNDKVKLTTTTTNFLSDHIGLLTNFNIKS